MYNRVYDTSVEMLTVTYDFRQFSVNIDVYLLELEFGSQKGGAEVLWHPATSLADCPSMFFLRQ